MAARQSNIKSIVKISHLNAMTTILNAAKPVAAAHRASVVRYGNESEEPRFCQTYFSSLFCSVKQFNGDVVNKKPTIRWD